MHDLYAYLTILSHIALAASDVGHHSLVAVSVYRSLCSFTPEAYPSCLPRGTLQLIPRRTLVNVFDETFVGYHPDRPPHSFERVMAAILLPQRSWLERFLELLDMAFKGLPSDKRQKQAAVRPASGGWSRSPCAHWHLAQHDVPVFSRCAAMQ